MARIKPTPRRPWLLRYYYGLKRKPWAQAFLNYWASRALHADNNRRWSTGSSNDTGEDSPKRKRPRISESSGIVSQQTAECSSSIGNHNSNASVNSSSSNTSMSSIETSSVWNTFLEGSESESSVKDSETDFEMPKKKDYHSDSSLVEGQVSEDSSTEEYTEPFKPEPNSVSNRSVVQKGAFLFESLSRAVAVLHHPCTVAFCGKAQIQVVHGCLRVFGYQITPEQSKPFPVCSSPEYCLLTFTSEESGTCLPREDVFNGLKKLGLSDLVHNVSAVLTSNSVVLVLHKLDISEVAYACSLTHEVFHFPRDTGDPTVERQKNTFTRLGFCLLPVKIVLRCWNDAPFTDTLHLLSSHFARCPEQLRVVVCGGRNVGKSTFVRYVMNSMLNACPEVYHIEADPGQTEFTPSTCVSLTKIKCPIFGLPFTNQVKPEKVICLGSINIPDIPETYLNAVTALHDHYASKCHNQPLIVNTLGWNAGLGLSLLIDIIQIFQPTHVIQLRSDSQRDRSKYLPYMTPEYIRSSYGWRFNSCQMQEHSAEYTWKLIDTNINSSEVNYPPNAATRRELMMLAYLGRLQSEFFPFRPLNYFTPYVVPWSSVGVYTCKHDITLDQILFALNCSWIALCQTDSENLLQVDQLSLRVCSKVPTNECLGFGIIRAIDPREQLFYIITPETLEIVSKVNLLLRGNANFPEILLKQQPCEKAIPYLSTIPKMEQCILAQAVVKRQSTKEFTK